MKELIDAHQAHLLMLGVLCLAPLFGLVWGLAAKRPAHGLIAGLLLGGGNYALWTVYNAITDKLGLDTVKNLMVNLGLFVFLGIATGLGTGWFAARERSKERVQGRTHDDLA